MKNKLFFRVRFFLIIICIPLLLYTGAFMHQKGTIFRIRTWLSDFILNIQSLNYFENETNVPVLNLMFKNNDYEKLENLNMDASIKNDGFLNTLNTDSLYVPVKIITGQTFLKGKARLKGNTSDSRDRIKLSLRFKMDEKNIFQGLSRFSIQHPSVKNFISEWLFHQLHSYFGLHTPDYFFVNVFINNTNKGLFSFEENFDQNYVKRRHLPEGLLIRFDEYWQFYSEELYLSKILRSQDPYKDNLIAKLWTYSPVDCFETGKISKDSLLYQQFILAKDRLESYKSKILPAHKIFNVNKLAKAFAIGDLFGRDHHYLNIYNVRFYFNPNDSLLEIIGFDNHLPPRKSICLLGDEKQINQEENDLFWYRRFFEDSVLFIKYIQQLNRISNPSFLDSFRISINNKYTKNLSWLKKEFIDYEDNSLEIFAFNQKQIITKLHPIKIAEIYLKETKKDSVVLEITNLHTLPAIISGIKKENGEVVSLPARILEARQNFKPLKLLRYPVPSKLIKDIKKIEIELQLLGTDKKYFEKVKLWPFSKATTDEGNVSYLKNKSLLTSKILLFDSLNNRLIFKPGITIISEPLIIPKGYILTAFPGTTLKITETGFIRSFSPMIFNGMEENKITIISNQSASSGIIINSDSEDTKFYCVDFFGNSVNKHIIISIYDSRVLFIKCNFYKDTPEAAIYAQNSFLDFNDCIFSGIKSKILTGVFSHILYKNELIGYSESGEWELTGSFFYNKTTGTSVFYPRIKANFYSRVYFPEKTSLELENMKNLKTDSFSYGLNRLSEIAY
ncbi:MAG: hypothetical protein A3G23_04100 [Bacteroidetes bacterium RIFCSPLOWO2_12_FULL_37_12]|nr:MAG: hypothetical protein A3G23_04100 [Bacteroidetes bacterium RIFCSPLOWO2_12_FULL_37_12]